MQKGKILKSRDRQKRIGKKEERREGKKKKKRRREEDQRYGKVSIFVH